MHFYAIFFLVLFTRIQEFHYKSHRLVELAFVKKNVFDQVDKNMWRKLAKNIVCNVLNDKFLSIKIACMINNEIKKKKKSTLDPWMDNEKNVNSR